MGELIQLDLYCGDVTDKVTVVALDLTHYVVSDTRV